MDITNVYPALATFQSFFENINSHEDCDRHVNIVYLDFQKAFNEVAEINLVSMR